MNKLLGSPNPDPKNDFAKFLNSIRNFQILGVIFPSKFIFNPLFNSFWQRAIYMFAIGFFISWIVSILFVAQIPAGLLKGNSRIFDRFFLN